MGFDIIYRPLFEIDILHDYFLDDGAVLFDSLSDEDKQKQLAQYDVREFLEVVPTSNTQKKLAGQKLVFKLTATGVTVFAKVNASNARELFVAIEDDVSLSFIIRLKDPTFVNYSALNTSNDRIFYFTNRRAGLPNNFLLIRNPNQPHKVLNDRFRLTTIQTQEVVNGLSDSEKNKSIFGIISLRMRGDNNGLSIVDTQGRIKSDYKRYEIHFENRTTRWRYINSSDNSELFTTAQQQPLTKNGFIDIQFNGLSYPNPSAAMIKPENNNFISEIYI